METGSHSSRKYKNNVLVSIIISNYNYGRYVGDAIDSALRQSYENIEVVVVDDGSTDRSREVIEAFGQRIKAIFLDHRGQCACLNKGFEISSGELVLFLDADDCLLDDGIAALTQPYLAAEGISQSQGYLMVVDRDLHSLGRRIPHELSPSGSYREQTLRRGLGVCRQTYTSGSLWPRWFLDSFMPLPDFSSIVRGGYLGPDGYLNNAARLVGEIASIRRPVARYRVHGKNWWHGAASFDPDSLKAHLATVDYYEDYLYRWCQKLGYKPDVARWRKWKRSWTDNLAKFSLSLMDPSQPRPRFHEVVLAPFMSGTTSTLKAVFIMFMLIFVWLAPKPLALHVARSALQRKIAALAGRRA